MLMACDPQVSREKGLQVGKACLLCVTGRHFMVEILDIDGDEVHISFPVRDFLVPGMSIMLEFHEPDGYLECCTQVLREPRERGENAVLRFPERSYWNAHRDSNRVNTDLMVHLREANHPRRYDGELKNLSTGGALIRTRAPLAIPFAIELTLSLPGEPIQYLRGRVVHEGGSGCARDAQFRVLGIRFVEMPGDTHDAIARYITERLTHQLG